MTGFFVVAFVFTGDFTAVIEPKNLATSTAPGATVLYVGERELLEVTIVRALDLGRNSRLELVIRAGHPRLEPSVAHGQAKGQWCYPSEAAEVEAAWGPEPPADRAPYPGAYVLVATDAGDRHHEELRYTRALIKSVDSFKNVGVELYATADGKLRPPAATEEPVDRLNAERGGPLARVGTWYWPDDLKLPKLPGHVRRRDPN